jgi:hypothetical protein
MPVRSRPRLNITLSPEAHAALGSTPARTVDMLSRALAAGDVLHLEQHYAATDAARDSAASRSATHAANVRHHGEPFAVDAWPTSDEEST